MPEMKSLTLNDKTYDCFVDSVARTMATWSALTDSVAGESAVMSDASNYGLTGLRVFGKTTQNGTPTPDAPVELVSLGDKGNITVTVDGLDDSQNLTLLTPNGLPGIKVTSGGNYTDANGQQWICDEIDFARGVYVQRVNTLVFDGTEMWFPAASNFDNCVAFNYNVNGKHTANGAWTTVVSNIAPTMTAAEYTTKDVSGVGGYGVAVTFKILKTVLKSNAETNEDALDEWSSYLSSRFADGTPLTVQYILATPIETPSSEEELAAYADLHTYKDYTTVSNDAGAWMDIEYVMDAKKYIDSLIAPGSTPSKMASVTLTASKWVTKADNLHSQVVTISGTTKNSKVDLLPSVEQLAIFHNKDVAFLPENEGGIITVYAIGDKPVLDYTMQVSITEVAV